MFNISNVALRLSEISLKVKECTQKCWAVVVGDCPLPMKYRILLYIMGFMIGIFLFIIFLFSLPFLLCFSFFKENEVLQSALAVFFLTFPLVTINWFIKNRDISRQLGDSSQQLKDSSQQLKYSWQQQNETLFSNSLQLLFKENDITVRSIGLRELVKLKQERRIDSERINFITSSGLQIKKASLQRANLQEATLQGADLEGASLQWANLEKADLRGVNLREADLREVNLREANLQEADIQKERLREVRSELLSIQRLNFPRVNLIEKDIQKANLIEKDLCGVDLKGANLEGANLEGANLQQVNLKGANLQGANLQGANLKESLYDEKTIFPKGFDPDQHGMIKLGVSASRYS